ncbi:hypothetical protein J1N35_000921 [Gossypium stocksii]|uniref:Polygalacturonase n=1 Tax=Gossypium stocksii TaxID=47602 RepID=A0A9D4AL77_9ROSI|nr:hypothetical protein J1N35_000921 [Gossypium stocksii]
MAIQMNIAITALLLLFTSIPIVECTDFDVVANFGAVADGQTDLSQPLMNAWKEACASPEPVNIVIPEGTYLLSEATLNGPCQAPISLQLQGTLMAPEDPTVFKEATWVSISHVDSLTMFGGGIFDGQGATAWGQNDCAKNKNCVKLPINIRFHDVKNSLIQDITTKDSKQFHVNVLGCSNITFQSFTVSAPEESLNTDGIHIGRSDGVYILDSKIETGDDCVSLGDGSNNVKVQGVTCGPGHGISIGSLGKYKNEEPISGVFVTQCTLANTMNGVRIKTWPASQPGSATDIHFEDITMDNVGNPILVDQEYCPWNQCDLSVPSRVQLSKLSFKNIRGTSKTQIAVKLICSSGLPCDEVELADIDLTYDGPEGPAISQCSNVHPALSGVQNPAACSSQPTGEAAP